MYIEKINNLVNIINKNKGDGYEYDLKYIEEIIDDFASYVKAVISMESAIQIARFRMDHDQYIKYIENLDKNRRSHHNACITNVKILNRLCGIYRCEKIFTDDEIAMDRTEIATNLIKVIVDEYFDNRKI